MQFDGRTVGGGTQDTAAEPAGKPTPRAISMEPLGTPAAGFVLLLAGEELHDSSCSEAAWQVARGSRHLSAIHRSIGGPSGIFANPAAGGRTRGHR